MSPVTEQDLAHELRRQAEQVGGAPLQLVDIRSSAGRIRRRHRLATGLAAVAAVAVAAPAGQMAVTAFDQPAERNVAGPTPSVRSAPTGPVRLTTEGLPRGEAPGIDYFDVDELVTLDGRRLPLPAVLQSVVPYADGYLGLGYAGEGSQVFHLDQDLRVLGRNDSGQSLTVSPDGRQLSWVQVEADGSQMLVNAPADGLDPVSWFFPERPPVTPVGFVDEDTVLYQTEEEQPRVGLATVGGETRELEGFVKVVAANPVTGLVAGQTSYSNDGSCWQVVDPARGDTALWDTCEYSLMSFSPDGRHILASDPYQSGLGSSSLTVLDALSGEPVATYRPERGTHLVLTDFAWEGDRTVLMVVLDESGGTWSVLRAGVDGMLETSVEPAPTDQYADMPFRFAAPE